MKKSLFTIALTIVSFMIVSPAFAAISFNTSSSQTFSGSATVTSSITIAGASNSILMIGFGNGSSTNNPTGVTVNGAAATLIKGGNQGVRAGSLWYFVNASGTENVSGTFSGVTGGAVSLAVFNGVNQTTPIDVSVVTSSVGNIPTPSSTLTTTVANDWIYDNLTFPPSVTHATTTAVGMVIVFDAVGASSAALGNVRESDSYMVTTSTGSYKMSYLIPSQTVTYIMAAMEPATAATTTPAIPEITFINKVFMAFKSFFF